MHIRVHRYSTIQPSTTHNKAYALHSLAVVWPTAHRGEKQPRRRISKTLGDSYDAR